MLIYSEVQMISIKYDVTANSNNSNYNTRTGKMNVKIRTHQKNLYRKKLYEENECYLQFYCTLFATQTNLMNFHIYL